MLKIVGILTFMNSPKFHEHFSYEKFKNLCTPTNPAPS